jgi:hypothetical protein
LAQRNRKRGRRTKPPGAPVATARPRRPAASSNAASPAQAESPSAATNRRNRSEERNAAVRAALMPLEPGERPRPLKIAVLLATLSGGVQLLLFIFGVKLTVKGTQAGAAQTIVFAGLMFACAWGMWRRHYQALLGFLALLGITIVGFGLALITASSLLGLAIGLVGVSLGGWLFFKLVRVLSRLQMPRYPGR